MLLFNLPIRGIIIINRLLVSSNNDYDHYDVLVKREMKNDKNHDTYRNYASIPIGSTVAVHQVDGGPLTHGTVVGKGDLNHNNRCCTIYVTKTGQLITREQVHKDNTNHS